MIAPGFEVNTDSSFIDPDWEAFSSLHDKRYGLAISYVKSIVNGESFDNPVMEMRVSSEGFYTQSKNFPAAFYGDTGATTWEFITEEEAQAIVFEAVALYRAGDARSITCVYSDAMPGDVFFGYRYDGTERYELGMIRANLPLHVRVMVEATERSDLFDDTQGVLVYHRTSDGKHLLIKAPGRRKPFPLLDGFQE